MPDRYIKVVLTVIALELFWIAAKDTGALLSAEAQSPATQIGQRPQPNAATPQPPLPIPVVITGVDISNPLSGTSDPTRAALPIYSARTLNVDAARPIAVVGAAPLKIEADKAVPVRTDEPLSVRSVPYTPGRTPGE